MYFNFKRVHLGNLFFLFLAFGVKAQTDSSSNKIKLSGFADIYYAYDFNEPELRLPEFLYSHAFHNEISINNVLIQLNYQEDKIRGSIGFHTGSYVLLNYAHEPVLFRYIYQANAGFEVLKYLWFDAGIFPSHLGFESAISKDNWTLTRSMAAENSPYYVCGAKLEYKKSNGFSATALILNGWQRIKENNTNKALGTQIKISPGRKLTINSSMFYGNEQVLPLVKRRFFHNFYLSCQIIPKFDLLLQYDLGWQENSSFSNADQWHAGIFIIRYKPLAKLHLAARAELFKDLKPVILQEAAYIKGASFNCDFIPSKKILLRAEGKSLFSDGKFLFNGINKRYTFIITASLAISI